jgi:PAS domain S-box-containing protein
MRIRPLTVDLTISMPDTSRYYLFFWNRVTFLQFCQSFLRERDSPLSDVLPSRMKTKDSESLSFLTFILDRETKPARMDCAGPCEEDPAGNHLGGDIHMKGAGMKMGRTKPTSKTAQVVTLLKGVSDVHQHDEVEPDSASPEWEAEVKRLRQRIADLEDLNRDLMGMVENSYDGLAIVDGESRLLLLNPSFERVMGLSNAAIVGRRTRELVEEGVSDTAASIKVIETRKPQTVMINTMAGRQVLSTGVPVFDRDGRIHRIYCNLRDITELNQLKEQCEQSQKLISKYLLELQEVKRVHTMRSQFIAHGKKTRDILETAFRIGRVDATVLVLGESGVGKELVARMIHEASPRAETGTFVKINCGAIPAELLESELFGYEGGAFTGASKEGKPGYFEVADKGTLMLDEIGDLPLRLQVKLLSAIQDQEVTRVGGIRSKRVDVRIIAATNRDLEKMMNAGKFKEALFYRLNVVPITIPPLRERKEDIPFLLLHYLEKYNSKHNLRKRLSKEAVEKLCGLRWPGNVRELANLMESLVVLTNEEVIGLKHLPRKYNASLEEPCEIPPMMNSLKEEVERYELKLIDNVVSRCATLEEAAHKLGISLSTLTRRLRLVRDAGRL